VSQIFDNVGNDRSGPATLTIDPNGRGNCAVSLALLDCASFVVSDFHHLIPNSAATLPPCANPNK
jgi:hypothetical protein